MIQDWLNLVPSENKNKAKFIQWLTDTLTPQDDLKGLADGMYMSFDVDQAVGVQLDILGEIVGVSRNLDFQPTVGDPVITDDDLYRKMIKSKIAQNQWDGTNAGIVEIWNSIFDDINIIPQDNQDMTVTFLIVGLGSQIEQELVENGYFVPKAQGVGYNYLFSVNVVFAFDIDNAFYSGFDVGYWL